MAHVFQGLGHFICLGFSTLGGTAGDGAIHEHSDTT